MYVLANQLRKRHPEDHHPSEDTNMTMHRICLSVHSCWVNEYGWIWSRASLRSTLLYEESRLNMEYVPNIDAKPLQARWTTCIHVWTDVIMQGYGVCPSMNMSKQQAKVSSIVPIFCIICLWSWPRGEETTWREHYAIPRCPHKMEVDRHFVLDSCPIGVSADSCPASAPWLRE